jgi:hypothetical protein
MWLPYPPEQRAEFSSLAELYASGRRAFRNVVSASGWVPAPGSQATLDVDAIAGYTARLRPGSEFFITRLCHDYLYAACEQLGALAALYEANEVLLSPNVVARCAVEHVAHVAWVLGEQADNAEERLARVFLEELAGAEHAKITAGHLVGKTHPEYLDRVANWKEVKADVARVFPAPTADDTGRPQLLGYVLPRPEAIVVASYGRLTPPLPEKQRQGVYDFLSNHVHPTIYTTRELFRPAVAADGSKTAELSLDPEYHSKLARLTIAPFHFALAHVLAYHGWPDDHLKLLEEDIEVALPGMLTGSKRL